MEICQKRDKKDYNRWKRVVRLIRMRDPEISKQQLRNDLLYGYVGHGSVIINGPKITIETNERQFGRSKEQCNESHKNLKQNV